VIITVIRKDDGDVVRRCGSRIRRPHERDGCLRRADRLDLIGPDLHGKSSTQAATLKRDGLTAAGCRSKKR